jgi:hypothetical protein
MNGFNKCTTYLTIYKRVKGFTVNDYYTKADVLYCEPITFFVPSYHNSITHLQTEILPDILLDCEVELSEVFYEIN